MRYYLLLVMVLFTLPSHAQIVQKDSLKILERVSIFKDPIASSTASLYEESPSAMLYRSPVSVSEVGFKFDMRDQDQATIEPLGTGSRIGLVDVNSYLRLGESSSIWAKANYKRGEILDVNWNTTTDYLLLYPHIVADSVGGDLTHEEYSFGGGYAIDLGRVNLAVEGYYRATQEYRQIDPRPHNVVSDFNFKVSGGIELDRYIVGVNLGARLYKQDQGIKFYDPTGANTSLLFMTGLGSYYARYSGLENTKVAYEGSGYSSSVYVAPKMQRGWFLHLGYNNFEVDRLYRPNNSIPVSRLISQQLSASTAYRHDDWSLRANTSYERRQGVEMVADRNGQGAIVDQQTTYNNHIYKTNIAATTTWRGPQLKYTLEPTLQFWHSTSSYIYPARAITLSQIGGDLRGGIERLSNNWRLTGFIGVGYYLSPDEQLSLAQLEESITTHLTATARGVSQNVLTTELSLRAERAINGGLAGYLEAGIYPRIYSIAGNEWRWSISCGIRF